MKTSAGSFAMTDGGANISMRVTEKFRVGAQVYVSNIGDMGQWRPQLDWAVGDYRFADWFGVRAGRVKTSLGLYNDTQDMEFLHTWALLPQSLYPMDLRYSTIAHNGGDLYGAVPLKKAGSVSYVVYGGWSSDDQRSGYFYNARDVKRNLNYLDRSMFGTDIRWNTPRRRAVDAHRSGPLQQHRTTSRPIMPTTGPGSSTSRVSIATRRRRSRRAARSARAPTTSARADGSPPRRSGCTSGWRSGPTTRATS